MFSVEEISETKKIEQKSEILLKQTQALKCVFFKTETCVPEKVSFKACLTCNKCTALTLEKILPAVFNKIVGAASFIMSTMGIGGSAGSSGGGGK